MVHHPSFMLLGAAAGMLNLRSATKLCASCEMQSVEGQTEDYEKQLRESMFCFAPYGVGWGIRLL